MNLTKVFALLFINLFLSQCTIVRIKEIHKYQALNEDDFPINGYYFYEAKNKNGDSYIDNIIFFYRDGVCLYLNGLHSHDIIKDYVTSRNFYNYVQIDSGWGNYFIQGGTIAYNIAASLHSGGLPKVIGVQTGKGIIIDKNSFIIKSKTYSSTKRDINENIIYQFLPFSSKPDSANWVKQRISRKIKKSYEK